ncbi:MAG: 30S ribosomal protein S4 [Senegalia sp. (in: firmicutes)]|jgi:small subunit ribosomal protein S4|uniref:30S ribosomal protein S4 n=1 Tax=Senegalia sp. (in: firmicutes) TaxID=1924098 RepID=UPI003F99A455
MARYTGPVCRQCRREGLKLYLKGDKCFTDKCPITRRNYAPGEHGQGRKKLSNYGVQLREKQKVRRYYGVSEKQFAKYFDMTDKMEGIAGENFLKILETRLDNVIYRLGLASSRPEARQLVNHGHFLINGSKVDIPSYFVNVGDEIEIKAKSEKSIKFKELVEGHQGNVPAWLNIDTENLKGKVTAEPSREDIELPIEEHLIVEWYSK